MEQFEKQKGGKWLFFKIVDIFLLLKILHRFKIPIFKNFCEGKFQN